MSANLDQYKVRPRKSHEGWNLESGRLSHGSLWYRNEGDAVSYAKWNSRVNGCRIEILDEENRVLRTKIFFWRSRLLNGKVETCSLGNMPPLVPSAREAVHFFRSPSYMAEVDQYRVKPRTDSSREGYTLFGDRLSDGALWYRYQEDAISYAKWNSRVSGCKIEIFDEQDQIVRTEEFLSEEVHLLTNAR